MDGVWITHNTDNTDNKEQDESVSLTINKRQSTPFICMSTSKGIISFDMRRFKEVVNFIVNDHEFNECMHTLNKKYKMTKDKINEY